ncbi:ABC-type transport auxiliary lipoprotein family protein [Oceanisphaera sp. IT1-181]|uniref:ABC-type transport auxiliary lipoprotein family protein n=1 Tax=Oceanisphaera sp. IT1-181 TaxID=3081199 RepID=UPI0029CA2E3F|nr:ABC-type transport auxiliary lipoprotein family protein [Oceanisphaera sp. IT1-181]
MSTVLFHCLPRILSGLSTRLNRVRGSASAAMLVGLGVMGLSVTGLSGCSILPKTEPVVFYRLPPVESVYSRVWTPPSLPLTVRIKQPDSSGLLASNRIAVIPADNQLSAYQGARWASSVPILFRDQITDAWLQSGRIQHVINDSKPLAADRELAGSLRAFQTEYINGQPTVVIHFDAQWIDPNQRTLLASRRFSVTEPAVNPEVPAIVAAFGVAQARLSQALLEWVLTQPTEQKEAP